MNTVFGPAMTYLRVSLAAHYARAKAGGEDSERGASAVEWVIISAIVVAIVAVVGVWLTNVLESKGKQVCDTINKSGQGVPDGSANCTG